MKVREGKKGVNFECTQQPNKTYKVNRDLEKVRQCELDKSKKSSTRGLAGEVEHVDFDMEQGKLVVEDEVLI